MKKKPQTGEAVVQTSIRLPREMHDRLAKGDAQFGEEVRRRLEASFILERVDPKTRELLEAMVDFADNYTFHMVGVPWHKEPIVFEQFKEGLLEMLECLRSEGTRVLVKPAKGKVTWEQTPPLGVGRTMARVVLHRRGLLKDE
jgi:predicted DNA-binding protein